MRLVITGAGGFLGKNLVKNLSDSRVEFVRLLDVNEVSKPDGIESDSYALDLVSDRIAELIERDDVVIHLAWRSNPSTTGADVQTERELNLYASENLIETCATRGARIVFVSSGGTVYGRPEYTPIDESHPLSPISAYGMVKKEVEMKILKLSEEKGLKYVILRPSNLYGPGFSTKKGLGVIGHWVEQVKNDNPLQIIGDGNQVRDFIHVDDLCNAIECCLDLNNEVLNVGTQIGVSLNLLKKTFEDVTGREIEVIHKESRNFDVPDNVLSIEYIKKLTGWEPEIRLEEGIRRLM